MAGSFIRAFTRVLAAALSGAAAQGQEIPGSTAGTVKGGSGGVLSGMTVRMDSVRESTTRGRARAHLPSFPRHNNPAGTVPVEGANNCPGPPTPYRVAAPLVFWSRGSVPGPRTSLVGRHAVRTFIGGE